MTRSWGAIRRTKPTLARILACGYGRLALEVGKRAGCLDFQPLLAHRLRHRELLRRALEDDAAVAHDVDAMRYRERDGELLLDQQDRGPAPGDLREEVAHDLDQHRR